MKRSEKPLLLLVNPKRKYRYHWDLKEICGVLGKKAASHPLALPLLASLTPENYEVQIVDEELGQRLPKRRPDLVGLTAMISNIKRAFEIADYYKAQNIPVVIGGPQSSSRPETALEHVTSVVIGEAENVWHKLLKDFEDGCLSQRYQADGPVQFTTSPRPRWDLVDTSRFISTPVQVSRGCPYHCEFCLVHTLFGGRQRYREIDDVIKELEAAPTRQISFADDNLTADKKLAHQLLTRMIPLGLSFSCQASIDAAYDKELIELLARAGCVSILFGFESLNPESLKQAHKTHNIRSKYEEAIKNVQQAGIRIIASFVVGFDADTVSTFDQIRQFTLENNLSYVMVNALAAYPGTDFYKRMEKSGRLAKIETNFVNGIYPTVHYARLTRSEMFEGCLRTLEQVYSYDDILRKGPSLFAGGAYKTVQRSDITSLSKLRSIIYLTTTHLFSFNAKKRQLFFELLKMVYKGTVHVANAIQYLLFIASFKGYLEFNLRYKDQVLAQIGASESKPSHIVGPNP
jgi:radical SAM superfamily enzyme YgiQ (UPF0313 family)